MKISSISLEKIKFKVSKKAYNKVSGVRKDIREIKTLSRSYYDKDFLYISISELKKLKDSGAIYSIDR
jgi:hypothetical protein